MVHIRPHIIVTDI